MSALLDDLETFFINSNLLDEYEFQFGLWDEERNEKSKRYFVVQQVAGGKAEPWYRQPNYRLIFVSKAGEGYLGSSNFVGEVANDTIEYIRENFSSSDHAFIEALTDPVGPMPTKDNRYIYEFTIRTFTRR